MHLVSFVQHPPIEHPNYDYAHDARPDKVNLGWPALVMLALLVMLVLLAIFVHV